MTKKAIIHRALPGVLCRHTHWLEDDALRLSTVDYFEFWTAANFRTVREALSNPTPEQTHAAKIRARFQIQELVTSNSERIDLFGFFPGYVDLLEWVMLFEGAGYTWTVCDLFDLGATDTWLSYLCMNTEEWVRARRAEFQVYDPAVFRDWRAARFEVESELLPQPIK